MKEFLSSKAVLSSVRRCAQNYKMIEQGDKIAVGVSGGKDSLTLLCALALMRRFYPVSYDIVAITVDLGLAEMDFTPVEKLCKELEVEYVSVKTDIAKIVFENQGEHCSLCSRMRRGALHTEAKRLGCNKVALGHTKDDVAQTLLLNILYAGKIEVFWPKNTPDDKDMTLIRPLIYTTEKTIASFCSKNGIVMVKNACPYDKKTKRQTVSDIISSVEKENKGALHRIFRSIEKLEIDGFYDFGE
jgi:tRNA(Ile)-lysidine synthase TilS/MesJ